MSGIRVKASVIVRTKKGGRFPKASYAEALSPARASLVRDTQRAFDTASDPVTGRPWPARKVHVAHKPLVKSGTLKREAVAATSAATITGSSLTVVVKKPHYAGFQAKGTRLIAARRFVGASIGTVQVARAGLARAGKKQAVRVLRGKS
jgi:hypothetical protein